MANLNHLEAFALVISSSRENLYETCQEAYKDFYGIRGRHMWQWSKEDLIQWWQDHYFWDADEQYWRNAVPFQDDMPYEQGLWYDTSKELE